MMSITLSDVAKLTPIERAVLRVLLNDSGSPVTIAPEDRPDVGQLQQIPPAPGALDSAVRAAELSALVLDAATETPETVTEAPETVTGTPETVTVNGREVDRAGLPWDARIHSTPAKKKADGFWRARRNLDPAVQAQVEAELRQNIGAPAPVSHPVVAQMPPPPNAAQVPPAPPAQVPPPPNAAQVPPAPNAAPVPTAGEVLTWVAQAITNKKLTVEEANAAAVKLELSDMSGIVMRPDLIPAYCAAVGYENKGQ